MLTETDNQRTVSHFCKISSGISSKSSSSQKSSKVTAPFAKNSKGWGGQGMDHRSDFPRFWFKISTSQSLLSTSIISQYLSNFFLVRFTTKIPALGVWLQQFSGSLLPAVLLLLVSTCLRWTKAQTNVKDCSRPSDAQVWGYSSTCHGSRNFRTVEHNYWGGSSWFLKGPQYLLDLSTPTWDPSSNLKHS